MPGVFSEHVLCLGREDIFPDGAWHGFVASGLERAQEFSWERVTAKVEDYYGFVIRRLAAQGKLPAGFPAEIPPSPRVPSIVV